MLSESCQWIMCAWASRSEVPEIGWVPQWQVIARDFWEGEQDVIRSLFDLLEPSSC
jgi:hypothetical protein